MGGVGLVEACILGGVSYVIKIRLRNNRVSVHVAHSPAAYLGTYLGTYIEGTLNKNQTGRIRRYNICQAFHCVTCCFFVLPGKFP